MKICMIGKYPPIQGGVSMRNYWAAHGLAKLGHEVHLVTNALEVDSPYRMYMRPEDWDRCDADYGDGSVRVHWTEPSNRRQSRIPRGRSHVTKLSSLALDVAGTEGVDTIYSFYTEPYSVAGYLTAMVAGLPHVARTAGSDAGRLWQHPQYAPVYDSIYRSLDAIICGPSVATKMREIGVEDSRIHWDPETVSLSQIFDPRTPPLDVNGLIDEVLKSDDQEIKRLVQGRVVDGRPYLGVYGKLGKTKGTFALLAALEKLVSNGHDVGLLAMAHMPPSRERVDPFAEWLQTSPVSNRVVQIPYLPHWRVPEFVSRCVAICCLEQDFPITFHSPVVAREVLSAGKCLIGSTEVILKMRSAARMANGLNCIAIRDVNDIDELTDGIARVVDDPEWAARVGERSRRIAVELDQQNTFPRRLEHIISQVTQNAPSTSSRKNRKQRAALPTRAPRRGRLPDPFDKLRERVASMSIDERVSLLDTLGEHLNSEGLAEVFEILAAGVLFSRNGSHQGSHSATGGEEDRLFRVPGNKWAETDVEIGECIPALRNTVRLIPIDEGILKALGYGPGTDSFGSGIGDGSGKIVLNPHMEESLQVLDDRLGSLLELCDGRRTISQIAVECSKSKTEGRDLDTEVREGIAYLIERQLVTVEMPCQEHSGG